MAYQLADLPTELSDTVKHEIKIWGRFSNAKIISINKNEAGKADRDIWTVVLSNEKSSAIQIIKYFSITQTIQDFITSKEELQKILKEIKMNESVNEVIGDGND